MSRGLGDVYKRQAPKDMEAVYREAGIDEFISVKANCYDILRMLQQKKGMKITEEEVK